jgi:hypothetical protein
MTKNRKRKIYEKMKSNVDKFGPIKAYNRCNSLLPKSTLRESADYKWIDKFILKQYE